MKYLLIMSMFSATVLFSCSTSNKKSESSDESFETEITQNDSIANDLEVIETEIKSAADELDNALNDLETE